MDYPWAMMQSRVNWSLRLVPGVCLFVLAACSSVTEQRAVTVKGSDTMVQLGQRWAEVYMNEHADAVLQVTGGGSGIGIAALINGSTDIAQASRMMRDEEKESARAQRGAEVSEIPVALDALAVYLNQENPIESLTIAQIDGIFRGEITNWSQVGGAPGGIVLYGRENSSGTYVYFKEQVMDDADFAPSYQSLPGTAAVINAVANDPNGVGYGGIGYVTGVKAISISPNEGEQPIAPSEENVWSNTYPLSRNLYFYTIGEPDGLAGEFIAWTLSPEGQAIVSEIGYYPLR